MEEKLVLKAFGKSSLGLVRKENEDFYIIDEKAGVYIVADGLGGHEGGEIASKLAVNTILEYFQKELTGPSDDSTCTKGIDEVIEKAHQAIIELSKQKNYTKGMGTTVVFALFQSPARLHLVNVGDSRAYLFRDQQLGLVSQDHSLVVQLVQQGTISPEEARAHRLRNVVTQALGVDLISGCYQKKIDLKDEDKIILCSDGLWDALPDEAIKKIACQEKDPEVLCERLIESANEAGGKDNITVIVLSIAK